MHVFTLFSSISGYFQYLIWGWPTMLLSPTVVTCTAGFTPNCMGHVCCAARGEVHWLSLSLSSGGSVFELTRTTGTTMGTDIRVTGILDYELSSSISLTIRVSSPPIILKPCLHKHQCFTFLWSFIPTGNNLDIMHMHTNWFQCNCAKFIHQ